MLLNFILFIVSLWTFIDAVCTSMNAEKIKYVAVFWALCVMGIFSFTGWTEVFYWFSGAAVYSFPMSFLLLGVAIALRTKGIGEKCVAGVLIFLAMGGALEIAGVGCFVLLGICILKWLTNSLKIRDGFIFGTAFLGALINTVAPGNYIRHAVIDDTGLHLGMAVIHTVLEVMQTVEALLYDVPCILLIIAAVIIGASIDRAENTVDKKILFMIVLLCLLAPFVTCFPVFLGYSMTAFPNRCKFIETVVIICAFVIISAVAGYVMSEKLRSMRKGETCVCVILFLILMSSLNPSWRASQYMVVQMWEDVARGSYKRYYEKVNEIYDLIRNDPDENVFIYEMPEEVANFPTFRLNQDMSWADNSASASYYGKESVQVVYAPLAVQENGQKNIRISQKILGDQAGYLSIYEIDEDDQVTEIIQEREFLDSNMIISRPPEKTGKIKLYLYEDQEGMIQLEETEIEY